MNESYIMKALGKLNNYEILTSSSDITKGYSYITIKCKKCGHIRNGKLSDLALYSNCPVCINHIIVKGINDLWAKKPDVACLLENSEDGFKYSEYSNHKVNFICPSCGQKYNKKIQDVTSNGLRCKNCNDSFSYGEKLVRNILLQLNVDFEIHKKFTWSNNKEYDFYITSINTIVEVHGQQHYFNTPVFSNRSLEDEIINDGYKKELALNNNIDNYIIIDMHDYDDERILKELYSLFNLLNVNAYEKVYKQACIKALDSIMIQVCEAFNNNLDIETIIDIYKIGKTTVYNYVKRGFKLNLCNSQNFRERDLKRMCELYNQGKTINEISDILNISDKTIRVNLHKGTKLKYCNYIPYERNPTQKKPVRCITTNKIFKTMKDGYEYYHIGKKILHDHLIGLRDYAGKDDNDNKLVWEFV